MTEAEEKEAKERKARRILQLQETIYKQSTKDFATFLRAAWRVLEPATKLKPNWHHDLMCEYLTAVYYRQIKRIIFNLPPRHIKSTICTVTFPPWVWIQNPGERFMCTSYSDSLSSMHSVSRRTLIESQWYQDGWGDRFKLASDQNVKTEFKNDKMGVMLATSMHGTATGKGGSMLIFDDPHDAQKIHSDATREADIQTYDQKFSTRLDDKENGCIIVVMQRLHEEDLTGHLLEKGGWTHVSLEGICEEQKTIHFPISGKTMIRQEGELLHPERESQAVMEEHKKDLGASGFDAQIQQKPTPKKGRLINPALFKRYKVLPEKMHSVIQSWDMSFKDTSKSDFVCGQVWGLKGSDFYLFPHCVRDRLDFDKTVKAFKGLTLHYPQARSKIVEDKANGPAVISHLRSKIPGIKPYNPKDSKEGRVQAILPYLEAGNIWIPDEKEYPWVREFLRECAGFPKGKKDDQVDAMTQAILNLEVLVNNYLRNMVNT